MFKINTSTNRIEDLKKMSFNELHFSERNHLQEWLANNPKAFGEKDEKLLIIQKEYNGFNDTNERLDLLAIDKKGNLVIIENKLDDSGRDVTWQALKYVSYCSTLTKDQIAELYEQYLRKIGDSIDAKENLCEFLNKGDFSEVILNRKQTQRIILVAANFRKEVTSTVMWLLQFGIRVQCYKATPYSFGEHVFLTLDQIIPVKDAEDFMIKGNVKEAQETIIEHEVKEIEQLRFDFWVKLLHRIHGKSPIYQNISPRRKHWLYSGGTGISGAHYSFIITKSYVAVELGLNTVDADLNKEMFDLLIKQKESLEIVFGNSLFWQRLDNKRMSRISYRLNDVDITQTEEHERLLDFLVVNMIQLEKSFREPLKNLKTQLSKQTVEETEVEEFEDEKD